MLDWLKKNRAFLSIRAIEKYLDIPATTLSKAVSGVQELPPKHNDALFDFIEHFKSNQVFFKEEEKEEITGFGIDFTSLK
jgi:hypothetical protein